MIIINGKFSNWPKQRNDNKLTNTNNKIINIIVNDNDDLHVFRDKSGNQEYQELR